MKTQNANSNLSVVLIILLLSISPKANSQNSNFNFNISANNLYFPGDEIKLNLYAYNDRGSSRESKFKISVLKIRDAGEFYSRQSSRYITDVLSRDSLNLLYLTKEIYSFERTFKGNNNSGYNYLNESIPIDIRSRGAYLVKVISSNKVAYCGFIVSNLGLISKAGNNSMLAFVVDRKTGEPVSNAVLDFYLGFKKIGEGKTSDGIFYQSVNDDVKSGSDEEQIPLITAEFGDDVIVSDPYLFFGYSGSRYLTYIFTEQPVYRTNSEVNFKGTIRKNLNSKLEPLSSKDITVIIKDPKNAEVYKKVMKTNEMGSFAGSFMIDEQGALGEYTIFANIDENNSYSSSFSVEQYKKPEYKVEVITDKSQYYGNDLMKASIQAKYFFGSPVADADIEYNIYKVRYFRPWWRFSEYSWWYEDYYDNLDDNQKFSGAEFIYSGTGKTGSDGRFEVDYKINEEFSADENYNDFYRPYYNSSDYRYIVQAKVTDKSRREISGTAAALVTRGGFSLSANTDKYFYKPGESVNIEVSAFDYSDKPVETDFETSIFRSYWERDYSKERKDLIKTVSGKTRSDGKGIVSFQTDNNESDGNYLIEIKSKDDRNNVITATSYFYVSSGDMWWYNNTAGGIQIIPDKADYKQGETCHALVLVTNPDVNALITTNTDDILSYRVEKFSDKSRVIDIPITEKYNSGFEINVNYVWDGAFFNSSKRILVIPNEKFLSVQIDPSKLVYKPKESGEVKVRVLDNFGNPVSNAEVSIGVVDESIYSIKQDNTKDIRKFFYGERYVSVSTAYNGGAVSNGRSRLITIYEKFNLKSTGESELAIVKGRLLRRDGNPFPNAVIVIDEDYQAAVTDFEGNFEFKLPAGNYSIGVYTDDNFKEDLVELNLSKGQIKKLTLYDDSELNEMYYNGRGDMSELSGDAMDRAGMQAPTKTMSVESGEFKKKSFDEDSGSDFLTPDVRSDFRDAIYWSPFSITDEDGYAEVLINFPDNLTTWRITSRVITEDTKVGQTASTVLTRKDLLLRMETPRFFQENDEITISTIVHNYLQTGKQTKVKFTCENVILENDQNEKTIDIAPDTDVRLDWKVKVSQPVGEARLYAEALTNEESDAIDIKVPLQPKGLKINKNTTADFSDENKSETKIVTIPSRTDLRSSEMQFTVDPSLASAILTALDELVGYPYGCVEQTMSRFLPTVVVANAFLKLNAPISDATKKDLPLMVNKGLQRLYGFQHQDGGWGWWENDQSNPFMTAYVVYGLSIARQANYEISESILNRGISAMKVSLNNSNLDETTRAYLLYSLAVAQEKDEEFFKKEIDKITASKTNDYTKSLIALTWKLIGDEAKAKQALTNLIKNVKASGESAAYWEGKQFHYNWQDDKVQTTAMALKALIDINEKSDLKDKVIRWLMMQRQGTAWRNTQETAIIIYSMVDYLKTSGELSPDYSVKIFLNGQNVFEKQITSDDVFRKSELVKIKSELIKAGENEIRIEKSGTGKVYFSSDFSYYNSSSNIPAGEDGFRIEREYFLLEKYNAYAEDKITYRKKYFSGSVKSGDEILVKLRVYSKNDDYQYFMLQDPLPSGVEVIKDDWAYNIEGENNYEGYKYYFWRWWYADKEVRDNRVTFFATYISKGEYEFSYIMQAQIPGDYSVNPATGMLMYYPEVNGNTGSMNLEITE